MASFGNAASVSTLILFLWFSSGILVLCSGVGFGAVGPAIQIAAGQGADNTVKDRVDAAYRRGMSLLDEKRYAAALEEFEELERLAPHLPQGASGEGIALALLGRPEDAIKALRRALAIDPSFWVARRELGIVLWNEGLKDQANDELQQIARLFPNDAAVILLLGQYEFERQNYSQALSYFSRAPGSVEQDSRLLLMKAEALLKTDQRSEAGQVLKTLASRPDLTSEQHFKVAWALGEAELYKLAIQAFNAVPADYPDRFTRDYGLALAYFEDGQFGRCIELLKALQRQNVTRPELFSLLGVAQERAGATADAYESFRQGIITHPSDAENYLNLATLASQHLNYDLAIEMLSRAVDRIPGDHELYLSRGIAYTLKAKFAEAMRDYAQAIRLAPQYPGNYLARGLCSLETGGLRSAVEDFQRAADLAPNRPEAYYFLTEALIQQGVEPGTPAFERARQAIDRALSLDSNLPYAYLDRAKLALRAQATDRAIADLEQARTLDPKSRSIAYLLAQTYQRKGAQSKAEELFSSVKDSSEQEAEQFRKDALTQALVVISGNEHQHP
jgi:tetratricopeptide (TPR) repeat protein